MERVRLMFCLIIIEWVLHQWRTPVTVSTGYLLKHACLLLGILIYLLIISVFFVSYSAVTDQHVSLCQPSMARKNVGIVCCTLLFGRYIETFRLNDMVNVGLGLDTKTTWLWFGKDHILAKNTQFGGRQITATQKCQKTAVLWPYTWSRLQLPVKPHWSPC